MDTSIPNTGGGTQESGADRPQQPPEASANAREPKADGQPPGFPDSPEKLQEAKRAFQNLDASGNVAERQIFINTLNMGSTPQYKENPDVPQAKKAVSFALETPEGCARFIEEYRNGEYLALAVTLAVFDVVTINDLPNIENNLIRFLPDVEETDDEGKKTNEHRNNPYLSLQSKLTVIGAKSFTRDDGQSCVGFGGRSKQILSNIWTQFPALRSPIISWLVEVNHIHKYRTTFDLQQIIGAFSKIISLDFDDAKREVFPKLESNPDNMFFLGMLVCFLVKDPYMKDNAHSLLLRWAWSNSGWLWKSALFSYAGLDMPEKYTDLKTQLQERLREKIYFCDHKEASLLVKIFSYSAHARQMLCELLHTQMTARNLHKREKELTAQFYLMMVTNSYYSVEKLSPELYFVACDTPAQQGSLSSVIAQVLANYLTRQWLFTVLKLYLEEISGYKVSDQLIKHIAAYFINLIQSAPLYRNDVLDILKECSCSASARILKLLHR
ncbi:hypothetical protein D1841_05770 [Neglecta sp. X4]|uniref:hypothetical protein n=1 Tax=unclassified Neglectibacter TaxID=2632164 RepID=UPI0013705FB7|nr:MULTISPECIES: hypothetical protein [unclassified Neglectibacter]NBI17216.1 hypothetical protein [Neglectibacter sp. 59]NBJ72829.1 hypothetical protein [Neglectibacter sp. X4]NCE80713.1 hypothetical protein [Neglectibacter sp. X58]